MALVKFNYWIIKRNSKIRFQICYGASFIASKFCKTKFLSTVHIKSLRNTYVDNKKAFRKMKMEYSAKDEAKKCFI